LDDPPIREGALHDRDRISIALGRAADRILLLRLRTPDPPTVPPK